MKQKKEIVTRVAEFGRRSRGVPLLENMALDARYALRVLRKSPAFTIIALITLMLGIGANVVVFGVLNAALLRPLGVSNPESLYQLRHKQWMSGRLLTTSYPAFEDFRRRNTTFSAMAGVNAYSHAALTWRNTVRSVRGDEVTGEYFDLLGVGPAIGRFFHAADEHGANSAPYVVLSDALWRNAFSADRSVLGTKVELNKHPFTVIGIAPASFHGAERFVWPDYWIPMANEEQVQGSDYLRSRTSVALTVLGRLKQGVTSQQATENLNAIAAQLAKEYPETDDGQPLRLIHPGLQGDNGDVIRGFLFGVTLLALLVLGAACANLATLFAARAAERRRELALRIALGSSRRRLISQLLTEAVLLSLMGGAAALAGAGVLVAALNRSEPFAGQLTVSMDARVYLAGLAFTLGSAVLFGMVPAWKAWRSSPLQMMKSGAEDGGRPRRLGLRDLLLCAQIAICMLLVTASLVAVRGMVRTLQLPLGFQPQGAMLADVDLSESVDTGDVAIEKKKAMIDAVRNIPGVTAAGSVNRTPFTGGLHGIPIYAPGTIEFELNNSLLAPYVFSMSPGYLEAAGTRLLRGRDVSWNDTINAPNVAIVNETFARRLWPDAPVIGQRFILWGKLTEVVGVAEDGKYHDLEETPQAVVYVPVSQTEQSESVLVVRSQRAPNEMAAALGNSLRGIAPNAPITVQSWNDALASELFPARAATAALGAMGVLAVMLALTGIFGMAAYNVSRRMRELGIRMALGARRTHVMSAAVGRPIVLLAAGSMLGLLAAMFATRLLGQIVYKADPRDPVVVAGALLMMALLGIASSAIPAYRALSIEPSKLMREE